MKSCAVVLVRNSFEYIPAFLAHHSRLVDRIFLIDHNSSCDLRPMKGDRVEAKRLDAEYFGQAEFINWSIDYFNLKCNYDLIFTIDIDEFLPFTGGDDIKEFFNNYTSSEIVELYWRNGCVEESGYLNENSEISFCRKRSSTRKLVYNSARTKRFQVMMGNHNAKHPLFDLGPVQLRPRPHDSGLGLLHIPFLGMEGLRLKVADFPKNDFADKIRHSVNLIGIEPSSDWLEGEISRRDYLRLVANYRTNQINRILDVDESDFERVKLFADLGTHIAEWRSRLNACPAAEVRSANPAETARLSQLKAGQSGYLRQLRKTLRTDPEGGVRLS